MRPVNKVQLITYPDSLGGDLAALNQLLENEFVGLFPGGVHILPPFPSSGDRGFAPLTYLEIEPSFGSWEQIKAIGKRQPVLLDLMVNHISARSTYFQSFLKEGPNSEFADLFITLDKIWPDGQPVEADIQKMFLRRQTPYSEFKTGSNGEPVRVWTTFGRTTPSEQIDLDVHSLVTRELLLSFLKNFKENQVSIVRLDAVGYVIKKPGTSSFFVEPEIFQFLDWIRAEADELGLTLLPEIHSDPEIQYRLAEQGYWIYDFILPYMVLNAYINKTSTDLEAYLSIRPHKQFTMLDCHDGIPIKPDLNGIYKHAQATSLVETLLDRGGNLSLIVSPEHKDANGFDVHQVRGTLYSLMGRDDKTYLGARALQLFTPGIPQIYYVGLLAGEHDLEAVHATGEGRELNRHNFTLDEVELAMEKPVVKKLFNLIELRNNHPAFNGVFSVHAETDQAISLSWRNCTDQANLQVDFESGDYQIYCTQPGATTLSEWLPNYL